MSASSVLILLPARILFFAQKHLVAGLTAGGAKGSCILLVSGPRTAR